MLYVAIRILCTGALSFFHPSIRAASTGLSSPVFSVTLIINQLNRAENRIYDMFPKSVQVAAGLAVALLLSIQLVQPERTNPRSDPRASFEALVRPPQQVASSLRRACGDCHSNQTN